MKCVKCDKDILPDKAFCGYCGLKVQRNNDNNSEFALKAITGLIMLYIVGSILVAVFYKEKDVPYTNMPTNNLSNIFHGVECSDDCSGHEAGYEWADKNGITDESDCGGNSESFIQGCLIYVEEL